MQTPLNNDPNRMTNAYNNMMLALRNAFEESTESDFSLQKALLVAKDEMIRLGEVTADDAYTIGEYIKHDINEAAEYMMESSEEFCDWLMLDIDVVERKVIDMFLSVADNTRVEIEQLNRHTQPLKLYNMGEIAGLSIMQCTRCNGQFTLKSPTALDACKSCGNTRFIRSDY